MKIVATLVGFLVLLSCICALFDYQASVEMNRLDNETKRMQIESSERLERLKMLDLDARLKKLKEEGELP